jgi:hypothetical protein
VTTDVAPSFAAASRAGRPIAWLMIGLLLLQWAAQLCAAHCGMTTPADRIATVGAAFVAPSVADGSGGEQAHRPAASEGQGAAASPVRAGVDSPCLLIAWCDLGQVAMVAVPPGPDAEPPPRARIVALPGRAPSFLRAPEERPPTA